MRRIVVTGAESTGKTTLARRLARSFDAAWTPEYVRRFVDETRREIRATDIEKIARGQLEAEDAPLESGPAMIVHDTNLLSNLIYMKHYFGQVPEWLEPAFRERDYTLYLLCLPDIPWEPDAGQRESAEVRERLHAAFKSALVERRLPHVEIGGDATERLRAATEAVAKSG